jgi:hypothetical protein
VSFLVDFFIQILLFSSKIRFNSAYIADQSHPEMIKLLNDCKGYNNTMIRLKLTDGETVARYKHGILMTLFATVYSICHILFCSILVKSHDSPQK